MEEKIIKSVKRFKGRRNKPLLIYFSLTQFYKFYAYVGYHKSVTNYINLYYMLGFYKDMAIIDLYEVLNALRTNFSLLIKIMLHKYASFFNNK